MTKLKRPNIWNSAHFLSRAKVKMNNLKRENEKATARNVNAKQNRSICKYDRNDLYTELDIYKLQYQHESKSDVQKFELKTDIAYQLTNILSFDFSRSSRINASTGQAHSVCPIAIYVCLCVCICVFSPRVCVWLFNVTFWNDSQSAHVARFYASHISCKARRMSNSVQNNLRHSR